MTINRENTFGICKEEKLKYDSICVDCEKINSIEFNNIEKDLISSYEKEGYTLREKNPKAELQFRSNDSKPVLTMVYLFVKAYHPEL